MRHLTLSLVVLSFTLLASLSPAEAETMVCTLSPAPPDAPNIALGIGISPFTDSSGSMADTAAFKMMSGITMPSMFREVKFQAANVDSISHTLEVFVASDPRLILRTGVLSYGFVQRVFLPAVPLSQASFDETGQMIPQYHEYRLELPRQGPFLPLQGQSLYLCIKLGENALHLDAFGQYRVGVRIALNGENEPGVPGQAIGAFCRLTANNNALTTTAVPGYLGNFSLERYESFRQLALTKGESFPLVPDAVFANLFPPAVNSQRETALRAGIKVGKVTDSVIYKQGSEWGGRLVARTGSAAADAPGVPGAKFKSFGDPVLNENGEVAFSARLALANGGPTLANDYGIWSDLSGFLRLALREGDIAPGLDGVQRFFNVTWFTLGQDALFIGATTSNGATTGAVKKAGIWKWDGKALTKVISAGDDVSLQRQGEFVLVTETHTVKTFSRPASTGNGNASSRTASANSFLQLAITCTDGTTGVVTYR